MITTILKIVATNITGAMKQIITKCRYSDNYEKTLKNQVIRYISKYSSNILQTILKSTAPNKIAPALGLLKPICNFLNTTKNKYK